MKRARLGRHSSHSRENTSFLALETELPTNILDSGPKHQMGAQMKSISFLKEKTDAVVILAQR